MDAALTTKRRTASSLVTALAPPIPHVLSSAFNIWYNMVVSFRSSARGSRDALHRTVILNAVVYPIGSPFGYG
jgi:hypothetical protein